MRKMTGLVLFAGITGLGATMVSPASAGELGATVDQHTKVPVAAVAKVVAVPDDVGTNGSTTTRVSDEVTPLAGTGRFTRGGLTCDTKWFNTAGSANCFKNNNGLDPNQVWRAHYRCQFQSDFYSPRQTGPGKHGAECNFGIQGVDIAWG